MTDEMPESQKKQTPAAMDYLRRWEQSARAGSISGQLNAGLQTAMQHAIVDAALRKALKDQDWPVIETVVLWYLTRYEINAVPDSAVKTTLDRWRERP